MGDGNSLGVAGEGTVDMDMLLNDGVRRGCALKKVLYIPKLAYNLVSVSRAAEAGKTVHFDDSGCEFHNERAEVIALGVRQGTLYYLKFARKSQEKVNVAQSWSTNLTTTRLERSGSAKPALEENNVIKTASNQVRQ